MAFDIGVLYKMLPSNCELVDLDLLDVMLCPRVSDSRHFEVLWVTSYSGRNESSATPLSESQNLPCVNFVEIDKVE